MIIPILRRHYITFTQKQILIDAAFRNETDGKANVKETYNYFVNRNAKHYGLEFQFCIDKDDENIIHVHDILNKNFLDLKIIK